MRTPQLATRSVRTLTVPLLLAGVAAGIAPAASAATARARSVRPAASLAVSGQLYGVAGTSASSAWAVGAANNGFPSTKTLILRWNGTAWKQAPSPSPAGSSSVSGVAATSASNAWAVGDSSISGSSSNTLIPRWNGKTWT